MHTQVLSEIQGVRRTNVPTVVSAAAQQGIHLTPLRTLLAPSAELLQRQQPLTSAQAARQEQQQQQQQQQQQRNDPNFLQGSFGTPQQLPPVPQHQQQKQGAGRNLQQQVALLLDSMLEGWYFVGQKEEALQLLEVKACFKHRCVCVCVLM